MLRGEPAHVEALVKGMLFPLSRVTDGCVSSSYQPDGAIQKRAP